MCARRSQRLPVLLTNSTYFGTLAAVRAFGRLGAPVVIADSAVLAPAAWSRYVGQRLRVPALDDIDPMLRWLTEFGQRNPNHLLYPASDEMAWLLSRHREELSRYYKLFSPPFEAMYRLLNKQELHAVCSDLGIDTPATVFPEDMGDLERQAESLQFPIIIKPKTQAFLSSHIKGALIHDPAGLARAYREFCDNNTYPSRIRSEDPSIIRPMVQEFIADGVDNIYSISGFIDETGELVTLRASRKVLQQPTRIGIGVCFESAPVDPKLRDDILRLCREVGYYGLFEVEFIHIRSEDRYLLTDFNPRYYNQLSFDIARGLPAADLVYHAATGDRRALAAAIRESAELPQEKRTSYCYLMMFKMCLHLRRLLRAILPSEVQHWNSWMDAQHRIIDPVLDAEDRWPSVVNTLAVAYHSVRHPGHFIRTVVLNR